jgi:hypothetical protein
MASATKKEQEAMREVARKEREVARKEQEAAKEAAWKARESAWEAEMKEKEGILETMAKELDDLKSKRGSEATSQVGTPGKIAGAEGQVIHEGREVCEANLGDTASVKEVVGAELAPLVQLVSHLTARVEQLSRGAGSVGTAIDEGTGQAAVGQNSSGGSQPSRVPEGWGGMKIGEANSLFKLNLAPVAVTKAGDSKFEAAKQNWDRLVSQFDITPGNQAKLLVHAFEGAAAVVFHQVAAANPRTDADVLWDLMRRRLYNTAQVQSQRARFTSARMARDESVGQYAERLRELACGLPETLSDEMLLQRFRDGLSNNLKISALAVTGEFDAVVSQVEQISDAMEAATAARTRRYGGGEAVNSVTEQAGTSWVGGRRSEGAAKGSADAEWTRDISKPRGSLENPVGFSPKEPEDVRPWNRARKCFRCMQYGHIRVGGTQQCEWPEADSGNGRGGDAAGTPP